MKISNNWLKQYIDAELSPEEISIILTNIGLEVESIEPFQSIKGGLEGVVVGKVLSCEKHPNAEKLHLTQVNIGQGNSLAIVCGAPNVAAGQTVFVATIGTKLYDGDKEFVIQKTKIRGEESCGMICAEDELGVGTSHDGIIVLPDTIHAGALASDYYDVETDVVFEIGLTPNRIDAASHYGVARDLSAFLNQTQSVVLRKPTVDSFKTNANVDNCTVEIENAEKCPRYTGLVISGISVKPSPHWLQNKLRAIGQKPINNVVDITNYILHELGQPLHAFDLKEVGSEVHVKTVAPKTNFITLDGISRQLSGDDLMICNKNEPMCIAGIFGGNKSGVTESTTDIFLESAYFSPKTIRSTSKRLQISTDASFRFERGIDPNITLFALKRAATLIVELAGGSISANIFDSKPEGFPPFEIGISFDKIDALIGKSIEKKLIKKIITGLGIVIEKEENNMMHLKVPAFKVDVRRPEDVVEEILRIYGYNNVEIPTQVNSSITFGDGTDDSKQRNIVSQYLCSNGFFEIMCNSITKAEYYDQTEGYDTQSVVKIFNPLSSDLNVMRGTLLFGALETIVHNNNRQIENLRLFEFGRIYIQNPDKKGLEKYTEKRRLSIIVSGHKNAKSWNQPESEADFFFLKSFVENVISRMGIKMQSCKQESYKDLFINGLQFRLGNIIIAGIGLVHKCILKKAGIDQPVYYADIKWDELLLLAGKKAKFKEIPKFFEVKRDLSMLIDATVTFEEVKKIALQTERNYLKEISIFDVYQGKGIPEGKKSYAVSFKLQDEKETMKDSKIDAIMNNLIRAYKENLGAELR